MNNKIQDIIFDALQNSYVDAIVIHKIDSENSAIEMDYYKITEELMDALDKNGYHISKKVEDK